MTTYPTDSRADVHVDGIWYHGDARAPERIVRHEPDLSCPLSGGHPISDCGINGGFWEPETFMESLER